MKICVIGDAGSVHIPRWAKWFSKKHEVHVITERNNKIDGVKVHYIPYKYIFPQFITNAFKVRKLVRKIKPDIVHAHSVTVAGFWGSVSGWHPFIISPWGSDIVLDVKNPMFYFIVRISLTMADFLTYTDKLMLQRLNKLSLKKKHNFVLLKWGVDITKFKPKKQKHSSLIVISIRNMQSKYKLGILLNIIPDIKKLFPKTRFKIKDSKGLRKYIKSHPNIKKLIEIFPTQPNDKMPRILNSGDIFVDTLIQKTTGTGIGTGNLEAMSCGLVVILPNNSAMKQYFKHNIHCCLYSSESDLKKQLLKLLSNIKLRKKLSKNSRKYIVKNFCLDNEYGRIDQFYSQILKSKSLDNK